MCSERKMAARVARKWRTGGWRFGAVLFTILIEVVNGYEEVYTISQLSPKSISGEYRDIQLETSRTENTIRIPASRTPNIDNDFIEATRIVDNKHSIVERSADPVNREYRSINIDEIPISSNNDIEQDYDLHQKRKYYNLNPTKTIDYLHEREEDMVLSSSGFGDRFSFKFPGEANGVPRARALQQQGPRLSPSAVQPIFATENPRFEGRQNNPEIQNIITGIVKLLNGNVNVQADTQLGRPNRPMNSRINNRGPPRIADVPPLPSDFDKPVTPPLHAFHPTKTPPPYPFDRPHHGVNIPEQIVPPMSTTPYRPGFHRPLPPWQRPRPRPIPGRRPPPMYKPTVPPIPNLSEDTVMDEVATISDNETSYLENNIHDVKDELTLNLDDLSLNNDTVVDDKDETTAAADTTTSTTTTTTTTTTTEATTTESKPETTTTEKSKPEKPEKVKLDKEKKKDMEKEKIKDKPIVNKTVNGNDTQVVLESSKVDVANSSVVTPTPGEGIQIHAKPTQSLPAVHSDIKTSSIEPVLLTSSEDVSYHPYRPRPGIVLDDTDFKPHGSQSRFHVRPEASVITASETRLPGGYGEIFDVTVSAIQGPGEKGGASVHIENVNPISGHAEHDDIIVSASGDNGFVSIDGKRTYLNLFGDSSTATPTIVPVIRPTKVQRLPQQTPSPLGTGIAIPADDVHDAIPHRPARPSSGPAHSRPQQGYRRPQPTVRIDTCIVGDDSTCDQTQNEKCRTESGISSCQCRPGYARRTHRDPCRRVVALVLSLRVDKLYDRKIVWDMKLLDKESEPYQQLSYEALRAIDSAFSMTPFSDEFVGGSVNSIHRGDINNQGVFVNYTILIQESPETLRSAIATEIQKHIVGVIRRRSNNVGASAVWVDTPAGSVLPLQDLDECASSELNDCHQLAICTNTWGGFRCTCLETTRDSSAGELTRAGRFCESCPASFCSDRGVCTYNNNQPQCSCTAGYLGSSCEVDGEVLGVSVGASVCALLVIAVTLYCLMAWSRKWSREQKAVGMGSPVFSYMANTIKTPPVGQPPYQVSLEERMRWAQIAEAMAQANHYAQPDPVQQMATRPSSAMFGGYPTLPPVPLPRMGLHMSGMHHTGTMNTLASRANTLSQANLYGYTNHMASESTSSEASSHVQDRADLLVPRPKSRARSMHNQTGIYYDVEYENAPEPIYSSKGIPLSTYTVSRGPPFYRS